MSDIDFDELDEAVNNVLGSKAAPQDAAVPADNNASEKKTVIEPSAPAPARIVAPTPRTPLSSPAAKRSGRFMDMVHPSSDMAGENAPRTAPKLKIVPSADFEKESAAATPVSEEPAVETNVPAQSDVEPETTPEPTPETNTMPDPLDVLPATESVVEPVSEPASDPTPESFAEKEDEVLTLDAAPSLDPQIVDEPSPALEVVEPVTPTEPTPAETTPFLTDAKVEKRPLGGFGQGEVAGSTSEQQLEPEQILPEALQSDIVAVESSSLTPENFSSEADETSHVQVTPQSAPAAAAPEPNPSIQQQYRSAPQDLDETPHPIFDTDQYHQPMIPAHTAHKGSRTWVFVLIILALLIVGAALGYFAFMSGL